MMGAFIPMPHLPQRVARTYHQASVIPRPSIPPLNTRPRLTPRPLRSHLPQRVARVQHAAVCHLGAAQREGARLVENDGVHVAAALQRVAACRRLKRVRQGAASGGGSMCKAVRRLHGCAARSPEAVSRRGAQLSEQREGAPLIRMPCAAPTPVPTMTAVGVARPSAQGHAMTRTAMPNSSANRKWLWPWGRVWVWWSKQEVAVALGA